MCMDNCFVGEWASEHWLLEWEPEKKNTKTWTGVTGWARVAARSQGDVLGALLKVHKCAHVPCQAIWEKSKWGSGYEPVHFKPSTWMPGPAEPAEVYMPPAAPPAVADASPAVADAPPAPAPEAELGGASAPLPPSDPPPDPPPPPQIPSPRTPPMPSSTSSSRIARARRRGQQTAVAPCSGRTSSRTWTRSRCSCILV